MSMQARDMKPVVIAGLAVATVFVAITGAAAAKILGMIAPDDARRIIYMAMGLLMLVAGNLAPKLRIFEHQGFPPARAIAAQRFAGWTLVIAGLAIAGVLFFSASRETALAASFVAVGAFALTGAVWMWLRFGPREPVSKEDSDGAAGASAARQALAWILFGLFWAFATFLVDYLWGDEVSKWMAIALSFVIVLAAPVNAIGRARRLKR